MVAHDSAETVRAAKEAVAKLLYHNSRGILLARDELDGWFQSFNQYSCITRDSLPPYRLHL